MSSAIESSPFSIFEGPASSTSTSVPLKPPSATATGSADGNAISQDEGADQGSPVAFNSTIKFTVNSTSAMVDLDSSSLFRYDTDTSARRSPAAPHSGMWNAWFVGTAYSINGRAAFGPGLPSTWGTTMGMTRLGYPTQRTGDCFKEEQLQNGGSMGSIGDLPLAAYKIENPFLPGADLTFYDITFDIPITTQAEDFTSLQSQATTLTVVEGQKLNPRVGCETCSVLSELKEMTTLLQWKATFERPFKGAMYSVIKNSHVLLFNSTELVYTLPKNTSLVEVLGPVGTYSIWVGQSQCYATLDPRPPWWNGTNFPLSTAKKMINATDQTVFMLPLPPNIRYTLRVGSFGQENSCSISALRTYPFHFNYAPLSKDSTNGTDATGGSGTGAASTGNATGSSKSNKTGVIVGVVVGVVGGLLVLGLAFWLWRRKRNQQRKQEETLLAQPYSEEGSGQDIQKGSLPEESGTEGNETPPGGASETPVAAAARGRRSPVRHLVQEEDAEEVYEYLPPRYREAWQQGPSGSSVPPRIPPSESPGRPSSSSSAPGEPNPRSLALDKQMSSTSERASAENPPLKAEYARAFGAPSAAVSGAGSSAGPGAGSSSGRSRTTTPAGPRPLESGYKRRFDTPETPAPSRPLVQEYKEAFPSPPVQVSSTGPLPEDYKRAFEFGPASDSPA